MIPRASPRPGRRRNQRPPQRTTVPSRLHRALNTVWPRRPAWANSIYFATRHDSHWQTARCQRTVPAGSRRLRTGATATAVSSACRKPAAGSRVRRIASAEDGDRRKIDDRTHRAMSVMEDGKCKRSCSLLFKLRFKISMLLEALRSN